MPQVVKADVTHFGVTNDPFPGALQSSCVHGLADDIGENGRLAIAASRSGAEFQAFLQLGTMVLAQQLNGFLREVDAPEASFSLRASNNEGTCLPIDVPPLEAKDFAWRAAVNAASLATTP